MWMRRHGSIALAALGIAMGFAACATEQVRIDTGPRSFTERDYERVYDRWTREEDEFAWGTLSTVLHVSATFESWEFRWAYIVRYAFDHSLDTDARDEMMRASLADCHENHRFFVTLAGSDFRESDLTGRSNAWRVLLVDPNGRQTPAVELEQVRRLTAAEKVYFPSTSIQRRTFRVVFPVRREDGTESIPSDADWFKLRFTGARGRVDLTWEITRG
jgi:hypothetical protein